MSITHTTSVGEAVRARMAETGQTQVQLAAHLGLFQQGVSARLAGKVPFRIDELTATAQFLDCSVNSLLTAPSGETVQAS